ncbi:type II toxin-antitoxin system PemK/MazF family toxin [Candidatus Viridilinea mediisalina]|uniref:mRNA interferase n=1 Tax=Candidatus Viridilinea mediisalina TaxID=2024553 RepID=A0A2A6RNL2_9CHLR|nr:type II toxin-antitoxin system PemK/MazF family toxin [Candidatus Viridilinea mediisalina]PDW04652.1 growth inhibitor PemK [Candidatus Viridilinea mediisalina]
MTDLTLPSRGDIWLADLNPTRGHEQAGMRPVLIYSTNIFNHGPSNLLFVVPLTTKVHPYPFRVRIDPPEGGLREPSFALCDSLRSISKERLVKRWGKVSPARLEPIADYLRILLEL